MKLLDDFFVVERSTISNDHIGASIRLNPLHIIYTAHFPGYPVTPGAIQLQLVSELLEKHFQRKVRLLEMPQCKFLKILDPQQTPCLDIAIDFRSPGELLRVRASGRYDDQIFFRLEASYLF